jgi:tight adherence protein C
MPPQVIVGSTSIAVGVVAAVWLLASGRSASTKLRGSKRAQKRLMMAAAIGGSGEQPNAGPGRHTGDIALPRGELLLARWALRISPGELTRSLERRIALAGVEVRWPIERILAAKLVLGGLGLTIGLMVFVASPAAGSLLIVLLCSAGGFFLSDGLLYLVKAERQDLIQKELADTLDQIVVTVEAGLGFEAAVDRVTRSGSGPLKAELSRMLRDIQLGVPREQAFEGVLDRTDVPELRNFVRAVAQAERYGIAIGQILRVQAAELRDKRRQRAEEQAAKVAVKMTIPTIVCILPVLFIVTLAPALINGF